MDFSKNKKEEKKDSNIKMILQNYDKENKINFLDKLIAAFECDKIKAKKQIENNESE